MKDRARYNRLLSINSIVPFIHLPTPPTSSSSVANGVSEGGMKMKRNAKVHQHEEDNYYDDEDDNNNNNNDMAPSPSKKSKVASNTTPVTLTKLSSGSRERSSSDCVVTALLTLGTDRQ